MRKRLGTGFREANDAETGAAQRRIEAENDLMRSGDNARRWLKGGAGRAWRPAQALFHPFELLRRDAHHADNANAWKLSKGENKMVSGLLRWCNASDEAWRVDLRGPTRGDARPPSVETKSHRFCLSATAATAAVSIVVVAATTTAATTT